MEFLSLNPSFNNQRSVCPWPLHVKLFELLTMDLGIDIIILYTYLRYFIFRILLCQNQFSHWVRKCKIMVSLSFVFIYFKEPSSGMCVEITGSWSTSRRTRWPATATWCSPRSRRTYTTSSMWTDTETGLLVSSNNCFFKWQIDV